MVNYMVNWLYGQLWWEMVTVSLNVKSTSSEVLGEIPLGAILSARPFVFNGSFARMHKRKGPAAADQDTRSSKAGIAFMQCTV